MSRRFRIHPWLWAILVSSAMWVPIILAVRWLVLESLQ